MRQKKEEKAGKEKGREERRRERQDEREREREREREKQYTTINKTQTSFPVNLDVRALSLSMCEHSPSTSYPPPGAGISFSCTAHQRRRNGVNIEKKMKRKVEKGRTRRPVHSVRAEHFVTRILLSEIKELYQKLAVCVVFRLFVYPPFPLCWRRRVQSLSRVRTSRLSLSRGTRTFVQRECGGVKYLLCGHPQPCATRLPSSSPCW